MISIDSVNILISLHPSMHFEVPYPTPTQWVLFSSFFSSRFPLLKPSFPELFFKDEMVPIPNGWQGKTFSGKAWKWEKSMTDAWPECIFVECETIPIFPPQFQFQIARSIVIQKLWTCYLFSKFIRRGNYFFLLINKGLLHYLPIMLGNFSYLSKIFHTAC